jgi:hypothetical protein
MRQIEEQWRIDARNPPNLTETLNSILHNYKYNQHEENEINNYSKTLFKNWINTKCSSVCLRIKNTNYNDCLDSCLAKVLSSSSIYDKVENNFNSIYSVHQKVGTNYFQS